VRRGLVLVALGVALLSGCSSGVVRPTTAGRGHLVSSDVVASKVTLSFTPEAQKELSDNLKFNQNTLLDTIKRALQARKLLDESNPKATQSIEILLTDIRVRSSFNAFMFGFMAGADRVKGDVTLRDVSGTELDHFSVYADYALGGLAGAQDEARMGWLYEKFAQLTVQNLTGDDQK
jgi:Domain of unknown function (DUF4410)